MIKSHQEELSKKWGIPVGKPDAAISAVESGISRDAEAEMEKLVKDLREAGLQEKGKPPEGPDGRL